MDYKRVPAGLSNEVTQGAAESLKAMVQEMAGRARKAKRALIDDVARLAGVSPATVSRVFNGSSLVATRTREAVIAAAHKLDYYPSTAARNLATGKNRMIGLFAMTRDRSRIEASSWDFYLRIWQGVNDVLRADNSNGGYRCWLDMDTYESVEKNNLLQRLAKSSEIDGLLIILQWAYNDSFLWSLAELRRLNFPFVIINHSLERLGFDSVSIDNHGLSAMVVESFLGLGRRRIGWISGPEINLSARERLKGFRAALSKQGLTLPEEYFQVASFDAESGSNCMKSLLDLSIPPDAVFCANDRIAAGALRTIEAAGLHCPDDIMLIGVDDSEISRVTVPALTTFALPLYRMGQQAALKLMAALYPGSVRDPGREAKTFHSPELIRRGSGG